MASSFDYTFVAGLVDFGRQMAGEFVGQPFQVYRLNPNSTGNVVDPANLVNSDLRAKVTHGRNVAQIENEVLHTNSFEFLCAASDVAIGDILVQNDPIYGSNTAFAVASKRPLKKVMCLRVESTCTIIRPQALPTAGSYAGRTKATNQPFVLTNGVFAPAAAGSTASVIPCGVQNIGQLKREKPSGLPLDTLMSWWFLYLPELPGLDRIRENDEILVNAANPNEPVARYRVHVAYLSPVGTAGQFLACEKDIA